LQTLVWDEAYETNLKNDTLISIVIFDRNELDNGPMSESPIYKKIMMEGIRVDDDRKTA
jgi:uncharacterized protein